MKEKIRILNGRGIGRFRSWLEGGAAGEPPVDMLIDLGTSEPLPGAGEVEQGEFRSRFELATYVLDALRDCDFNGISCSTSICCVRWGDRGGAQCRSCRGMCWSRSTGATTVT